MHTLRENSWLRHLVKYVNQWLPFVLVCFSINDFKNCTESRANGTIPSDSIYHNGMCITDPDGLQEIRDNYADYYPCEIDEKNKGYLVWDDTYRNFSCQAIGSGWTLLKDVPQNVRKSGTSIPSIPSVPLKSGFMPKLLYFSFWWIPDEKSPPRVGRNWRHGHSSVASGIVSVGSLGDHFPMFDQGYQEFRQGRLLYRHLSLLRPGYPPDQGFDPGR